MAKEPKLNLEAPDLSKAKLPLGEENTSEKSTPKLNLNSEAIGLAESAYKLSTDLAKVYENPIFGALKKIEDDKKMLFSESAAALNTESTQALIKGLQEALGNPILSSAFKTAQDYEAFTKPLLGTIKQNGFDSFKDSLLANYKQYLKPEYSATQSIIEQLQKTIDSPSIQDSVSHLENLGLYKSGLAKAAASIAKNEDLLKSSQRLNEIGKSIVNDSFKQRMNQHASANFTIPPIRNFEIPKNPLIEHSKHIVEQNDQLIETTKLQNDILKDIAEYMRMQSEYTELQNENIEYQIEQKEYEIESNREATKHTLRIAIASIVISIIVSTVSVWATYDVYHNEDISGQKDHKELIEAIKESSNTANLAKELQYQKDVNAVQQQQVIRLNQEVEQIKAYLNDGRH